MLNNLTLKNKSKNASRLSRQQNGGFAISELILAITILSFGLILIYGSFSSIFVSAQGVGLRFTASYLGQEGLDIIRNLRDTNLVAEEPWDTGLVGNPCGSGCQADYKIQSHLGLAPYDDDDFLALNSDGFYSYDIGGTPTLFKRKITITAVSENVLSVEVLVTWTNKGKVLNVQMNEYLYSHS